MTKKIVIFLISFAFLHVVAGASNLYAETFQIKTISVEGNNSELKTDNFLSKILGEV